jgi:hypothetical protein
MKHVDLIRVKSTLILIMYLETLPIFGTLFMYTDTAAHLQYELVIQGPGRLSLLKPSGGRCSVYLLYWYKSTNIDTEGAARCVAVRTHVLVCDFQTRGLKTVLVCLL